MITRATFTNKHNTYNAHSIITFEPKYKDQIIIKIAKTREIQDYYINKLIISTSNDIMDIIKPYYNNEKLFLIIVDNINDYNLNDDQSNVRVCTSAFVKENIMDVILPKITILNSNILDISNYTFGMMDTISLFSYHSNCNDRWIKYTYRDYNICFTVHLQKGKSIFENQITAVINHMSYCPNVNYDDYTKIVYGTLKSATNGNDIITLKTCLETINTNQILNNLNNATNEILFKKYLSMDYNRYLILNNHKIYVNNIKKIKNRPCINQEVIKQNKHDESLELYISPVTCDDWLDVIDDNKCFGILINTQCPSSTITGKTYENINIKSYTNTLMTTHEVLIYQNKYIEENHRFDMGVAKTSMISGASIGNGNSVLPIYINKYHWNVAKHYVEENISLAITQNSFSFSSNMLYIYPQTLMKYITDIQTLSIKDFHMFINLYVTIIELHKIYGRFDNNYKCFFTSQHNAQVTTHLNNALITFMMYGKYNPNTCFFINIYEEQIRRSINNFYYSNTLFKDYRTNYKNIKSNFYHSDVINNIFKLIHVKNDLDCLINEFMHNSGVISESNINDFKSKFGNCDDYDYCQNVLQLTSNHKKDAIIDNLFLQSYITRNNKKRKQSFNNKYKNIITSNSNDIIENNKYLFLRIC